MKKNCINCKFFVPTKTKISIETAFGTQDVEMKLHGTIKHEGKDLIYSECVNESVRPESIKHPDNLLNKLDQRSYSDKIEHNINITLEHYYCDQFKPNK